MMIGSEVARKKKWWLARSAGHVDHGTDSQRAGIARATQTREMKTKRCHCVQVQEPQPSPYI